MVQNFLTFFNSASNKEFIAFLFEKKLIKDRNICKECKKNMVLKDCQYHRIGKSWRCIVGNCEKYLNTISIYNERSFGNKKLDARMVLQIIFYLSTSTLLTDIVKYTNVKYISNTKIKNAT